MNMKPPITWARFPNENSLTMYLCFDHYRMGKPKLIEDMKVYQHWVLPPKDDSQSCIICRVAELEGRLAEARAEIQRLNLRNAFYAKEAT